MEKMEGGKFASAIRAIESAVERSLPWEEIARRGIVNSERCVGKRSSQRMEIPSACPDKIEPPATLPVGNK